MIAGAAITLLGGGDEAASGAAQVETTPERTSVRSVAVLPLVNRSGLEDDKYFTDGMHDEILAQLSEISDLSVRAEPRLCSIVIAQRTSPRSVKNLTPVTSWKAVCNGREARCG